MANFFYDKLLVARSRIQYFKYTVKPLDTRTDSQIKNQVLVTFESSRQRDEIKAKTVNLRGLAGVGCQMEPPDHLRGQYQVFQNLAYCLKKKTPDLKRSIKFDDREQALIMDVKAGDKWKTIEFACYRQEPPEEENAAIRLIVKK